ncbi:YtxH domain-containing protein [Clostridium rectalis]|uniref:YtxH domain-containing protein n=1 Tax=Clostridium rectalis TaxID=2040295 RepID=UPI000F641975|nr:YtxH domain-containing protein [Clostridium rectalis]
MQKKLLTGMVLGATAAMLFAPQFDKSTKRRIRRAKRNMRSAANEAYDNMVKMVK